MKKKLTIDEQIEDLKKKGVTFEIMCEEDAKKFLHYNIYIYSKMLILRCFSLSIL